MFVCHYINKPEPTLLTKPYFYEKVVYFSDGGTDGYHIIRTRHYEAVEG